MDKITVKTAELSDMDALERRLGGKVIQAEITGDAATVELQPAAALDWYVNVWNCQAVIMAGGEPLDREDYDGELYDRLTDHVIESLGGAINVSGLYYPQDSAALAMFGLLQASKRKGYTFTLGELAARVTGGNVTSMAKLLNDAGAHPRLNEIEPDPTAQVDRADLVNLYAVRAGDSVGRRVRVILGETMRDEP